MTAYTKLYIFPFIDHDGSRGVHKVTMKWTDGKPNWRLEKRYIRAILQYMLQRRVSSRDVYLVQRLNRGD